MTKLTRPIYRETESTVRSRGQLATIIVGLKHGGMVLSFHLKRHRDEYTLPVEWCFRQAVKAAIRSRRAERIAARKKRQG